MIEHLILLLLKADVSLFIVREHLLYSISNLEKLLPYIHLGPLDHKMVQSNVLGALMSSLPGIHN